MMVQTLEVDELIALAAGDENTGTPEDRAEVIAARAELAGRGEQVRVGAVDARAEAAMAREDRPAESHADAA